MMDVIQSPLNSAHQKGRLADSCEKSGKLDKAIEYHKEACEFLNETLQMKLHTTVYNSIIHQEEYHRKCIKLLEMKKKEIETIIKAKQNIVEMQNGLLIKNTEKETSDMEQVDPDENYVPLSPEMYISSDCDSLLQCLRHRSLDQGKPFEPPFNAKLKNFKKLKNESPELVIEELAMKNDALCFHIQELLKEINEKDLRNNELELEVKLLKQQLEQKKPPITEHTELEIITNSNNLDFNNLTNLELPPLEMPEFDFTV